MSLKQRLIGGAVIVVLAVIFVPIMLDGSGRKEQLTQDVEIPPEPAFVIEQSPSSGDTTAVQPIQPEEPVASPPPPEPVAAPEPPAEQTATTSVTEAPEPKKKQPVASNATIKVKKGDWIVQVGSFGQENNALVLRDKLRAAGFQAFIQSSKDTGSEVYRVRVGPEAKRDQADGLRARLLEEQKLKGIVLSHR